MMVFVYIDDNLGAEAWKWGRRGEAADIVMT
jgi:hypothetical protein